MSQFEIYEALRHPNVNERIIPVTYQTLTDDQIELALKDTSSLVRTAVVMNQKLTPSQINAVLMEQDEGYVQYTLIEHQEFSELNINQALLHEDRRIRLGVIRHQRLNPKQIDILLQHPEWQVRVAVVENQKLTRDQIENVLTTQIDIFDPNIRYTMIEHQELTTDQIERALQDPDVQIRIAVVKYQNLSKKQLQLLLFDSDVRQYASMRLQELNNHEEEYQE